MIRFTSGDIFESPAHVIVNPVNLNGVMGKGQALKFKQRYPYMFWKYHKACKSGEFQKGKLMGVQVEEDRWVLLFPTRKTEKLPSELSYIEAGLQKLCEIYEEKGFKSIAFPKIGCGSGGLNWAGEVLPLMRKYLEPLPIPVYIYE